jgi:hypothetical protein
VGGLLGYNFGFATMMLAITDSIHSKNSFDGWRVCPTLSFSLWHGTQ